MEFESGIDLELVLSHLVVLSWAHNTQLKELSRETVDLLAEKQMQNFFQ